MQKQVENVKWSSFIGAFGFDEMEFENSLGTPAAD